MHGYTPATEGLNVADNDFEYLKEVIDLVKAPVVAEGKIDTPAKLKWCLELGCHTVVVGGAITRPLQIARTFIDVLD